MAKPWIAKLGDPREVDRAVTELETLGDPGAITALGEAWSAQGKPVRMLQAIIRLARPLTPTEAFQRFFTDYEETGREASWDRALPYLRRAVQEASAGDPRSVDNAINAAQALGEARLGLDALIALASKPPSKQLIAAQVGAIRSIGAFTDDSNGAAVPLIALISREPPPHPRSAKDRTQRGRARPRGDRPRDARARQAGRQGERAHGRAPRRRQER